MDNQQPSPREREGSTTILKGSRVIGLSHSKSTVLTIHKSICYTTGFVTGSSKFAEGFREWYRNKYGQYPYEKCEDGTKWRFVFHLRDIPYIRDLYKSATIYLNRKIELYKKNWSVMI